MTGVRFQLTNERNGFGVKGRIGQLLVCVALVLSISVSAALAQTERMQIVDILQKGPELTVFLNQYNNRGEADTAAYTASAYTMTAVGTAVEPIPADSVQKLNAQIKYTILVDDTLGQFRNERVNNEVIEFADSLRGDQLRLFYYSTKVDRMQNYVSNANALKPSTSNGETKVLIYDNESKKPSLNTALDHALQQIKSDSSSLSSSVRHVIVVLTDTDADTVDTKVIQRMAEVHVPIFVAFFGSNAVIASRYAQQSGGVFYATAYEQVKERLDDVSNFMANTRTLTFTLPYDVFASQQENNTRLQMTLKSGSQEIVSETYSMALSMVGVPLPTATPEPTPTPTPVPPTLPPLATATPYVSPTPTAEPIVVEPVITAVPFTPTPLPTLTPTASPTPTALPTVPPTATPAPTSTPEPVPDEEEEDGNSDLLLIIGAGALFLIAVVILIIVFVRSKKKTTPFDDEMEQTVFAGGGEVTTYAGQSGEAESPAWKFGGGNDSSADGDRTVSPWTQPRQSSMFTGEGGTIPVRDVESPRNAGGLGSEQTIPVRDMESSIAEADYDKTLPVGAFGAGGDLEKTVRMDQQAGVQMKLTVELNGEKQEHCVTLVKKLVVGRAADCDVVVNDPNRSVSNHHLVITYEPTGLFVRDNGSTNGTKLNGLPISDTTQLRNNDVLTLGNCKMTVELFL